MHCSVAVGGPAWGLKRKKIVRLLGGELLRKAQDVVMVGGMGLWWMQGKKIEGENG